MLIQMHFHAYGLITGERLCNQQLGFMKEEKLIQNSETYVKCQQSEFSFMSLTFSTFSLSPESFTFKILAKNHSNFEWGHTNQ